MEYKALCSSSKCTKSSNAARVRFVIKDVPKTKTTCPDCGSSLFWNKMNTELKQQKVYKKRS